MFPMLPFISPISHQYIIKIKAAFQLYEFGTYLKICPPSLFKIVFILNFDFLTFGTYSPPLPFWTDSTFCDSFFGWLL